MNKSITQNAQNDKEISITMKYFFKKFQVSAALKSSNAYKEKGFSVIVIFQYLFALIFSNRTMYMNFLTGKNLPSFHKDTAYRFMKSVHINWIRFTTILCSNIIKKGLDELTSKDRVNVFIIDDSTYERNRSKKVELLTKIYDHSSKTYKLGFRMMTLGWSDGNTFLPVNHILLSSKESKKRINEAKDVDKRTAGFKRRQLSLTKGTSAMLTLLETAKKAKIQASYVLFDSWFGSPSTLLAVKKLGYDTIAMMKKTSKMHFIYKGNKMSLPEIYKKNKKRPGRSRYLLSVLIDIEKDGESIPAKIVYVRNKNKRSEYLCLISTDISIDENEIIRIYGKRWDIEIFFKICKSYLKLSKECNSLSFDSMTAHTAIVFTRYMMIAWENRRSVDERTMGEIFIYFSDELADITWIQSFQLMLQLFQNLAIDKLGLTVKVLNEFIEIFMQSLPLWLKERLSV